MEYTQIFLTAHCAQVEFVNVSTIPGGVVMWPKKFMIPVWEGVTVSTGVDLHKLYDEPYIFDPCLKPIIETRKEPENGIEEKGPEVSGGGTDAR